MNAWYGTVNLQVYNLSYQAENSIVNKKTFCWLQSMKVSLYCTNLLTCSIVLLPRSYRCYLLYVLVKLFIYTVPCAPSFAKKVKLFTLSFLQFEWVLTWTNPNKPLLRDDWNTWRLGFSSFKSYRNNSRVAWFKFGNMSNVSSVPVNPEISNRLPVKCWKLLSFLSSSFFLVPSLTQSGVVGQGVGRECLRGQPSS